MINPAGIMRKYNDDLGKEEMVSNGLPRVEKYNDKSQIRSYNYMWGKNYYLPDKPSQDIIKKRLNINRERFNAFHGRDMNNSFYYDDPNMGVYKNETGERIQ